MKALAAALSAFTISIATVSLAEQSFNWERTDQAIALRNGKEIVWQFNTKTREGKPYFHPLGTLEGTVLTDQGPRDHVWHHAGWFSFKMLNGVNYWEENRQTGLSAGRTEVVDAKVKTNPDFSAIIDMRLSYHEPEKPELISERRIIRVARPKPNGDYTIDWQMRFTAKQDVEIERTPRPGQPGGRGHGGYAGLSLRMSKALLKWTFLDSEGRTGMKIHGKSARWVTFKGDLGKGTAGVTFFDYPSNRRHPTKWFIVTGMPYYSPAFVFDRGMKLKKGEELGYAYRIMVHAKAPEPRELDAEFNRFALEKFELAEALDPGNIINLVELGKDLSERQGCVICHSLKKGGEPEKIGPGWYGMFGKEPSERQVMVARGMGDLKAVGQKSITADDRYIEQSIREPTLHLALRETDPEKGTPYPPTMPAYLHLSNQEMLALASYMKTLNDPGKRGPDNVSAVKEKTQIGDYDPHEIVVRDRPRILRVTLADVSSRAISVGLPGGFNYVFDPCTFSVRKAWSGGFLNTRTERSGRGKGYNHISRTGRSIGFTECLLPLGESGPVNQEFKDYINNTSYRARKLQEELKDKELFIHKKAADDVKFGGYQLPGQTAPVFNFSINGVLYRQRLEFEGPEIMHFHFETEGADRPLRFELKREHVRDLKASAGVYENGILTVPAKEAASFMITLLLDPSKADQANVASRPTGYRLSPMAIYNQKSQLQETKKRLGLLKRSNVARGARATSKGRKDGDGIGPVGAVDDLIDTYWDERDRRPSYRLRVELKEEQMLAALSLVGWRHHNFAAKDFDILIDGKKIKEVRGAKYDNNLLLVEFPKQRGRIVELVIDKYYGGSPAIRELGLYE